MLTKLKQKIIANKSSLFKIAIFLGLYFIFSDFSFANTNTPPNTQTDVSSETVETFIKFTSWVASIIAVLLGLLTYLTTIFLSPEWTNGSIFGMTEYLKGIWILVSNFVYFTFAFILIYVAFANIVGTSNNNLQIKQALPKFIVGILIVPFSWFLVQFMVSISSILTVASMNLPFEAFKNYETTMSTVKVPTKCTINLGVLGRSEGDTSKGGGGDPTSNQIFKCDGQEKELSVLMKTDKAADGIFGIMTMYTYGLLNIEGLDKLTEGQLRDYIKTIGDIVVKVVFDLIFVIIYALLMIALGLALMIRGIRLWIYMMLSPLFGLMYFFGKEKDGFFQKFNITEFLGLVMVPVYTMLALSFGMLFIYVTGQGLAKTGGSDEIKVDGNKIMITDQAELEIKGAIATDENITELAKTIGGGALGIVGALILKIFGVVILWGTVMAALKQSKITESIIAPIANFGEQVGKLGATLPQYVPILPGGQSLKSLETAGNNLDSSLRGAFGVQDRSENFLKSIGLQKDDFSKALDVIKTLPSLGQNKQSNDQWYKSVKELLNAHGEAAFKRTEFQEVLKMGGIDNSKVKNIQDLSTKLAEMGRDGNKYSFGSNRDSIEKELRGIGTAAIPKDTDTSESDNNNIGNTQQSQVININLANKQISLPTAGNGNSYQVSDAGNIANSIKSSLGVKGDGTKLTVAENEITTVLNGKGISNDVINEIIRELRNDGRIS
ncbi:hypothetical protein DLH72_04705 [Candidatus Gracilibacteria bacterium]|nr:MAG: hypothetical protein DLH72_04705 [Candidatus Gracilibacteria bacterium]